MATAHSTLQIPGSSSVVYAFLRVDGIPTPVHKTYDRVMRAGVPGVAFWELAARGEPFTVQTMVDTTDMVSGKQLGAAYLDARGRTYDFYWQKSFWGPVFVHAVMLHPVKLLTGAVGGLSSPAGAMVMADWTLETLV